MDIGALCAQKTRTRLLYFTTVSSHVSHGQKGAMWTSRTHEMKEEKGRMRRCSVSLDSRV